MKVRWLAIASNLRCGHLNGFVSQLVFHLSLLAWGKARKPQRNLENTLFQSMPFCPVCFSGPFRLIANVSVFVPAHLRNALLPFLLCNAYCSMSGRWADSNNSWWMSLSFDLWSMWLAILCCFAVQTYFAECHRASLFSYPCLLMPNCSMSAKYARFKNTDSFQMGQRLCLSPFYYILYWPGNLFSHSEIKCTNYLQPLSLHVHVFLHSTHLRVYADIYIYIHIHTYTYTYTSMLNILKAFNLSTILNMF